MNKTLLTITIPLLLLSLAACSTTAKSSTTSGSSSAQKTAVASLKVTSSSEKPAKLALGIINLENTTRSVDNQQAKNLLPLFKAIKSMNSGNAVSQKEMEALYLQIQQALTSEQMVEMDKTVVDDQAAQTVIRSLNLQPQTTTTRAAATPSGSNRSSGGGFPGGPGGGMPGGGIPGGGMPGGGVPGVGNQTRQNQSTQVFSNVVSSATTSRLLDAVILLLKMRAAS